MDVGLLNNMLGISFKRDARAEIEFIVTNQQGRIVPIEVKSGKHTQAKSLQTYLQGQCQPHKTIKLISMQGLPTLKKNISFYCFITAVCCYSAFKITPISETNILT